MAVHPRLFIRRTVTRPVTVQVNSNLADTVRAEVTQEFSQVRTSLQHQLEASRQLSSSLQHELEATRGRAAAAEAAVAQASRDKDAAERQAAQAAQATSHLSLPQVAALALAHQQSGTTFRPDSIRGAYMCILLLSSAVNYSKGTKIGSLYDADVEHKWC